MQIIEKKTSELKPYERNPRINDDAVKYVANSIKEFGWKVPIVIDQDNVIVAGHTRWKAAKRLKMKTVPCIVADDLTEEQIRAYRLADNKTAEFATWDLPMLDLELSGIDLDMEEFGFEPLGDVLPKEVVEDDFNIEPPAEPKAKYGDIYILGNHRVMCGDSTKTNDVECLMGGGQADLYITDPPYNVDYTGKTKDALTIKNDKQSDDAFGEFLVKAFSCADKVLKDGAGFYIWHSDSEGFIFRKSCTEVGWKVRQCLVWNKNAMVMGRQDYQWKHEPCLYGWKSGSHKWYSDRKQTTVIDMPKPTRNAEHPTMKPIPLFAYEIQNSSREGDIVLDSFGGSGTTLMACEQLNRTAYLMELDPRYVDVIIERWETFTGKKAVKENN